MKIIYFGTGGFWVTEAVYRRVKGVTEVTPGYMGGTVADPSHELVATGTTGHAEVVKVIYDELVISTEDVLRVFFALHDPSLPNHPTLGIGSQYRNVVFYSDENDGESGDPENGSNMGIIDRIIAEIQPSMPEGVTVSTYSMSAQQFYPAAETHYDYYTQHQDDSYCITIIQPKLEQVQKTFPQHFQ